MRKNDDTAKTFYKSGSFWMVLVCITALVSFAMYLNMGFANGTEKIWIRSQGQLRLSNITSSVENNLAQAESQADNYAAQLELMLEEKGRLSDDDIYGFVHTQNEILHGKTRGQCFSTYVAYENKLYIEGFVPDESFQLSERVWYVGAKKNQGNVYITDPYIDANTGSMCYTVSMLLDDNATIIGLDFYMDDIQYYIERMNEQIDGISMIVNESGMIVGHNDSSLVGRNYNVLKDYRELIDKVFNLYGDYFECALDNTANYTVFSDKTSFGWYLIICIPSSSLSSGTSPNTIIINALLIFIWVLFVVIYIRKYRNYVNTKRELAASGDYIKHISDRLMPCVMEISQQIEFSDDIDAGLYHNLRQSTDELKQKLENIASFQSFRERGETVAKTKEAKAGIVENYKRHSIAIITILLLASIISIFVNTRTQLRFTNAYMENEEAVYYSQTKSWIDTNIELTNDLAAHLGAQPELYRDYKRAVKYLDDVVGDNADISVAYIVNPAWEHTVIMNNGWEPTDPNWHVEERDWYEDTILSDTGFNISTPYRDEQTGMYCVTFSQIVHDADGSLVGLIGVDFYMDALIKILGESYTAKGYAFLTDPSYIILNHPYQEYQMSMDSSVNGAETEYRGALVSEKLTRMKDYDGKYKVALAQREPKSGFTVVTIRDMWTIYGMMAVTDILLAVIFLVSIISVLVITRYMSTQQEKLNQEMKKKADEAIAAGKAKSSFLAQMSHEIRTPINAVLGMNEMILRESKEEHILNYASNAYNAGKGLLSIINDILDISKIEAGKFEIVETEYDLYSLVGDCYHMIADRAAKKKLEFIYSVDETLPAKLYGDMFHIRQIIVNFLTNAVKYTDEGTVELVFSGKNTDSGFFLQASVKDTGIGLTDESMKKLFGSFQRFDLKRNQTVEGTGLGLSICKQLTELMGGTVEVESVYGKGSVFTCVIPQVIVDETPVGEVKPDRSVSHHSIENGGNFTTKDARILVVDDVEMNIIVFTGFLKGHGLIIDEATSGKQCLTLVQENKYDIIFMDHMMPEMDGIETFARMAETEHLNHDTPVVMLTANAISGEREKYLSAGFSAYLTKPIQSEKLLETLFACLPEDKVIREEPKDKARTELSADSEQEDFASIDSQILDVALGIAYFDGDAKVYHKVLKSYTDSGQERLSRIRKLCEQEAWKDYATEVHALKSTSLTIGSRQLSEAAKELELAGKSGDYQKIKEKNDALLDLYQEVLRAGEEELPRSDGKTSGAGAPEEIDEKRLRESLESILRAADSFDGDEIVAICKELYGYTYQGTLLDDRLREIEKAADDFECEKARELAEQMMAEER